MKDHMARVVDEAIELDDKRAKLLAFFKSDTYRDLDQAERNILRIQYSVMTVYSDILHQRIFVAMRDKE
jgi:hypothetical protein